jgi:hypothetical protein
MNFYNRYFFLIYKGLKQIGDYDLYFTVVHFICSIQLFNILTLFNFYRNDLPIIFNNYTSLIIITLCVLYSVNIMVFLYKKKYIQIIESNKNEKKKNIEVIFVWSYILTSIIFYVIS